MMRNRAQRIRLEMKAVPDVGAKMEHGEMRAKR